ncbi:LysR substrate-binding domain-containing protein [Acidocella sp.]|jgi:DNA-binding transcriptional LysR family regulator|uniref:LysR substrate-binding domain-containing protein n=1 Tax=Acidocella sp. TaxID=50710 RepID=UPI002F410527
MFDLNQLRCFVTVAEELHFGRAAARLNMTQPPLSRQIQVLEHIIDATLLERTSRSVRLTPAGRSFLPEAVRILKLAESASQMVRRIAFGKTGSLKIGFTATTAYEFLPELIAACVEHLPDVDLSLKEMVSSEQLEALTSGQLDVVLLRPPFVRRELMSIRVVAEPLLAAVPRGNPLADAEALSYADFDGKPFIMFSPYESKYFHDLLVTQFAKADVFPRYVQHLSQVHSVLALVRAGLGLAIVPRAAAMLHYHDVHLKPLSDPSPALAELFMVWRRDNESPLLPVLVDIACKLASTDTAN